MTAYTKEEIKNSLVRTYAWNGYDLGQELNLTYSFADLLPYWENFDFGLSKVVKGTINSITGPQKEAFRAAVERWESVANIHLKEEAPYTFTVEGSAASYSFGDIVVVGGAMEERDILGSTTFPSASRSVNSVGDIVIANTGPAAIQNSQLEPGQTGFNTFVHELGHALGLNHPVNYEGETSNPNPLPSDPGQRYTVMSYQPVKGIPGYAEWWASAPMLYDILAIQTLYGANPNTGAGDGDRYTFQTGANAIQAIWDADGSDDVIDASALTKPVTIDLRPGHFSFVGKDERHSVQQIAIAYQIAGYEHNWIENAIGGTSDDRLIGNDAVNRLEGNAGNDTLEGGKGDDILVGGAGFDTYVHRSGDGSDRIVETREADGTFHGLIRIESTVSDQLATGYFKPADDQPDTYTSADGLTLIRGATWQLQTPDGASIELGADFQSGDLGIRLAAAPPTTHAPLNGDEAGNYLSSTSIGSVRVDGLDGKDMIWGSAEADVLNGGDGNDWIVGDGGADHIDGGPGDDYITGVGDGSFVDAGGGHDIISAVGAEFMVIDRPNSPITADAFWTDVSQHWNSGHSAPYLHASGSVTVDYYGGIRPGETYRGESVLGGGWTYEFTITSSNVFNVKYMHPTLAPTGIAPARSWEHGMASMPAHVQGVALWGGDGNDLLIGHGAKDNLAGGKDNDILLGNGGDDDLKGGEGEDILIGGSGIDVLDGGSENDQLFGEAGGDIIFGGGGNDDIWAGPLSALAGADGDDYVDGGAGDDYVESGEGNDTLLGGADNDTLFAGAGSDVLAGGTGVDYLDGGAEQDVLHADDGADVLVGGIGDDTLEGGAGRDTYVYNLGDGIDRIDDFAEPGAAGGPIGNVLSFGAGIGPSDLRLGLGSLAIHLPDGGAIHIEGFNADDPGANPVIDTFEFADGTTLSYHQLIERGFDIVGTVQHPQLREKADKKPRHWRTILSSSL
ncbi:M10 family metallopeptidase [Methylocaldum szegediense]|uniref:M10 family metallopeptidase n=1 Tax=Methylocaldum szegediense TaxID=73780 RepID=UPI0003FA0260|nr:M10 family metallopeptidase [Methylocaldum szegediense]